MPKDYEDHLAMYQLLRFIGDHRKGTIIIIPALSHKYLARLLDYNELDVRTDRPYFYKDDPLDWRII